MESEFSSQFRVGKPGSTAPAPELLAGPVQVTNSNYNRSDRDHPMISGSNFSNALLELSSKLKVFDIWVVWREEFLVLWEVLIFLCGKF